MSTIMWAQCGLETTKKNPSEEAETFSPQNFMKYREWSAGSEPGGGGDVRAKGKVKLYLVSREHKQWTT